MKKQPNRQNRCWQCTLLQTIQICRFSLLCEVLTTGLKIPVLVAKNTAGDVLRSYRRLSTVLNCGHWSSFQCEGHVINMLYVDVVENVENINMVKQTPNKSYVIFYLYDLGAWPTVAFYIIFRSIYFKATRLSGGSLYQLAFFDWAGQFSSSVQRHANIKTVPFSFFFFFARAFNHSRSENIFWRGGTFSITVESPWHTSWEFGLSE